MYCAYVLVHVQIAGNYILPVLRSEQLLESVIGRITNMKSYSIRSKSRSVDGLPNRNASLCLPNDIWKMLTARTRHTNNVEEDGVSYRNSMCCGTDHRVLVCALRYKYVIGVIGCLLCITGVVITL